MHHTCVCATWIISIVTERDVVRSDLFVSISVYAHVWCDVSISLYVHVWCACDCVRWHDLRRLAVLISNSEDVCTPRINIYSYRLQYTLAVFAIYIYIYIYECTRCRTCNIILYVHRSSRMAYLAYQCREPRVWMIYYYGYYYHH